MKSVILAAGQATRMRPLSYIIPKILLPVKGKPVLEYLQANFHDLLIDKSYIVVSEQYDTVQNYLDKTQSKNINVVKGLGWETGGDLAIALQEIGVDDDIVVLNGDIITDANINDLFLYHIRKGAPVSMGLFQLDNKIEASRFGQINLDKDGSISQFVEKGLNTERISSLVNVGFYIFSKEFLQAREKYLTPRKFKLETELFPTLATNHILYGMKMNIKYWWDVGTMESYLKAEQYFINGEGIIPP
ncbi:nucleotidyltransferase family protein [Ferroplasma sp.]|uniref:nucleotidyltransferase family protein n=1 Tax=Ferroplasma sp. TaxID=2591003 RepID=UPI002614ED41|nr:nucleotidyltransferase family protein [Ferroplasma sp.]